MSDRCSNSLRDVMSNLNTTPNVGDLLLAHIIIFIITNQNIKN